MSLNLLYFASAGFSIILSIYIILTCFIFKLERYILLCGVYLSFLGAVAGCFAIVYAFPTIPIYREILLGIWLFGLSSAYPILLLVKNLETNSWLRTLKILVFSVVVLFQLLILIELIFKTALLIYIEDVRVIVLPLLKYVFIPFSFIGLAVLAVFLWVSSRIPPVKHQHLKKTFGLTMFCMLPFKYIDLYNTFVKADPIREAPYIFNFGLFVFAIVFLFSLLHYIQKRQSILIAEKSPLLDTPPVYGTELYFFQIYQKAINKITSRKLYLNENLTIELLAALLSENRNELSKAINMYYKKNFPSFINFFRVEELKKQLAISEQNKTILELGFETGFKSKTSINRAFYGFTKMSPSDYRKNILEQNRSTAEREN
jgi:AraC-like DNA-binding protein